MKKLLLSLVAFLAIATTVQAQETKRYLWQNEGSEAVNWNSVYRFGLNGRDALNECIATFGTNDWEIIKNGTFYLEAVGSDWVQMRITDGWWTVSLTEDDITTGNERIRNNGDGTFYIELNLSENPALVELLDERHLLFTGQGYTPTGLYVLEGEKEPVEKVSYWKNGEQSTIPAPNWSSEGRFSSVSNATGEETYAFPDDVWETLKAEPFRAAVETYADWVNLRVTDGWWKVNYKGMESLNDLIQSEDDGTRYVEIDLANDPDLLAIVDEHHLLFTGVDYKLLEIYQMKAVTGIKDINANVNATADDALCNLAGQRVNATAKGIIIKNGKKYLVK